ncbi:hypothetical protein D8B26_003324 [Coccidioides posadasii str. Silveira]|uniref:DnaJ domain containing protein n=1 Tax=Coccidioides posadasii (strain C735) TaxID=222929 RepID=C5P9A3_COCP7|nr:DnaJ domain containing protein [Coccidioides posadasii C735 delta SOWgp]EER26315.1 DnaJ domain containing protein [Coccidioides posadasii C735 delta SOWgp]QVM08643.1 hypothetical protein D8B26_003324 [Coccidioides posadasii str. Silveira]|eukprot:XP_003068460.1 DnaJ domain containing protein [Coccidioides posadasii C735 delta SOWgp]
MTSPLPPDPYAALGVSKDASTAEIKTAYRKLVLKCHPDKVKDESLRSQKQDEFQRVQEAYELLSDDTKRAKYDQKARMAEMRKEAMEKGGPSASFGHRTAGYDVRNGRVYEERVPRYYEEEMAFADEQWSSSSKYDGYEKRQTTKDSDEKKKKSRSSESKREPTKTRDDRAGRSSRAKNRDKERRRELSDKYSHTATYDSDSDESCCCPRDFPEPKIKRESRSKHPNPRPREYSDHWESSKHDSLQNDARRYIERTRNDVAAERERRSSGSPWTFSSVFRDAHHVDSPRRSSARPRASRNGSVDIIEPSPKRTHSSRTIPSLTTATSAPPNIKIPPTLGMSPPTRSSTYHVREKRDPPPIRRAETLPLGVSSRHGDPIVTKSSKLKDLYDSGYSSSSPGTPKISPPKSSKHVVVDEDDDFPRHRTVLVDPPYPSHRRTHSTSPPQREPVPFMMRPPPKSKRSKSRDIHARHDSIPKLRTSRDGLFAEITDDYYPRFSDERARYSPKIRQEDSYHEIYPRSYRSDPRSHTRKESCAY